MTSTPIVEVKNLSVSFGPRRAPRTVLRNVSLAVHAGECLALVGESGSGKSVTARTLVGLTGPQSHLSADAVSFRGKDTRGWGEREWKSVRGRHIGFVLQDALSSLDSLRPIGDEVGEALKLHTDLGKAARQARVLELLTEVGVPEPGLRALQYSHQLSGGLRQRALIASAIAAGPGFLIADEPTTALDATVAAQVMRLLNRLKKGSMGMLVVSHDLSVVAGLADRIAVMRDGEIVEQGPTQQVLQDPQHPYTLELLASIPSAASRGSRLGGHRAVVQGRPVAPVAEPRSAPHADGQMGGNRHRTILSAKDITKTFPGPDRVNRTVVDRVSFSLERGTTLGIVGESGSGKSTAARMVLGVEKPDSGSVLLHGATWEDLGRSGNRTARRSVQMIYQDPLSSFDPRHTVGRIIGEALLAAGVPRAARAERIRELLGLVRLGTDEHQRRPIELSGGQRQRVAIARALAAEPEVLICDEPVSALDVSVQAQILDLLADLQQEFSLSYLFISHDLGVIHHIADTVLVMKDGAVVESGPIDRVFLQPEQAYTRELLSAIPQLPSPPLPSIKEQIHS
ncbi:peptide/nickel transport system ATP-binding protein [Arthrobacter sp. CAN_A214]|uniref:dipeptide ABC transporter ATP-binding protein n=1 Tax=Arthrobacter sp. CAN_A214 TaxID=2787720 RepID=UPI0018CAD0E6